MRFGSLCPSEFYSQIRHPNAFTEIAWEDAEQGHGNVYLSVREKQGVVVYRQRVLQTVISLGVVSLVFRENDLLKIPSKKPDFRYGKN